MSTMGVIKTEGVPGRWQPLPSAFSFRTSILEFDSGLGLLHHSQVLCVLSDLASLCYSGWPLVEELQPDLALDLVAPTGLQSRGAEVAAGRPRPLHGGLLQPSARARPQAQPPSWPPLVPSLPPSQRSEFLVMGRLAKADRNW